MRYRTPQLTARLSNDLAEEVRAFMPALGFMPGEEHLAIRMLIKMGLAQTPKDAVLSQTRADTFNIVRMWTVQRVMAALAEIGAELRNSALEAPREGQGSGSEDPGFPR